MEIFISTINFICRDKEEKLSDILKKIDGRYDIEVASGHIYYNHIDHVMEELINWSKKNGKKVLLHNFSPPDESNIMINLSHPDKNYREKVKQFIKKRIDHTKKLGMDYYSFHGGYTVEYKFGKKQYNSRLPKEKALELFINELKEVVTYAEKMRVNIGIENHVIEYGNEKNFLFGSPDDFRILFDSFESRFLYLHLDFGHLNVSSRTLNFDRNDFVYKFTDKIKTVHLHENDGIKDEHKPINLSSWFIPLLKKLPELKYVVLETITADDSEINEMISILHALN